MWYGASGDGLSGGIGFQIAVLLPMLFDNNSLVRDEHSDDTRMVRLCSDVSLYVVSPRGNCKRDRRYSLGAGGALSGAVVGTRSRLQPEQHSPRKLIRSCSLKPMRSWVRDCW